MKGQKSSTKRFSLFRHPFYFPVILIVPVCKLLIRGRLGRIEYRQTCICFGFWRCALFI